MHRRLPGLVRSQQGVSTLVVAIILLVAATFLTFFAAKIGIQEQRMSGNDYRQKKTFALAEAGLDRAKAFLAADRSNFQNWDWHTCAGRTELPCRDGTPNGYNGDWSWINVYQQSNVNPSPGNALNGLTWPASTEDGPFILTKSTPAAITANTSFQPVLLMAQARSDDQTGRAIVRQAVTRFLIAQPGPVPPLMAPSVGLGGNFTVVGNPNHNLNPTLDVTLANCDSLTGSGQMISMWTNQAVTLAGSQQTCELGSFRDGMNPASSNRCIGSNIPDPVTGNLPVWNQCICQPNAAEKSPYSSAIVGTNDDIVQNDAHFPGDMFLYVFGRTKQAVKDKAAADGHLLPDCSSLNASSTGLYWVTGSCDVAQNTVIGSRAAPVILVYETSAIFRGGSEFWGMVVGADMERTLVASPQGPAPYYWAGDFTSASPATASLHGGFTLHGAMIVEGSISQAAGGGSYTLEYDPCVFAAMGAGTGFDQYGPVEGSWNDAF